MVRKGDFTTIPGFFFLFLIAYGSANAQQPGLLVEYFEPRAAPGVQGGLQPGDNLLQYDGIKLLSPATLQALEENPRNSSNQVMVTLLREGQTLSMSLPRVPLGAVTSLELPEEVLPLYRQSWVLLSAEDVPGSLNQTREAAAAMMNFGDKLRTAWIWWSQGSRFERAKEWAAAESSYKEALNLLRDSSDVAAFSRTTSALGNCRLAQGHVAEARTLWEQALQIDKLAGFEWWAAGDNTQLGQAAHAEGKLLVERDHYQKARAFYERAAARSMLMAGVLNNLGNVARALGNLKSAQDSLSSSLKIKKEIAAATESPLDELSVAGTQTNLGGVALARGDLTDSKAHLHEALAVQQRYLSEDALEIGSTLSNLGYVEHEAGDIAAAEKLYNAALAIFKPRGESISLALIFGNLGNAAYDRSDFATAEENYRIALAIFERVAPESPDNAKALHNMGNIQARLQRFELARSYHARARRLYEGLAPDSLDLAMVFNSMGALTLDEKKYEEAQQLFTRAVEIVESQRREIRSIEARAFLIESRTSEYSGLIRAFLGKGEVARAFETVERARARSLAEMIYERSFGLTADISRSILAKHKELLEKRNAAYFRLSKLDPRQDTEEIQNIRQEIQRLAIDLRRLTDEIRQESPVVATLIYPEPLSLAQVRDTLDPGTLLLTYFVDDRETHLFTVSRIDRLRHYTMGITGQNLDTQISMLMLRVASPTGVLQTLNRDLYQTLLRPAQAEIETADRILISPDGPLHKLAFSALRTPVSSTASASPAADAPHPSRYLIQLKPLHFTVSMGVYAEIKKRFEKTRWSGDGRILALGDPAYHALSGGLSQVVRECGKKREGVASLPLTKLQISAIAGLFGTKATTLVGMNASETKVRQLSSTADVIHIASHGYAEDCDPLDSFLALVPGGDGEDGLLHAFEIIDGFRLKADLVVLSACQTALGKTTKSEGIIGLTRAFQYAGSKTVMVSMWNILDDSTSQLMSDFYKAYRGGQSKDEALRKAQLSMIQSEERSHPYHWAAFVVAGDWH